VPDPKPRPPRPGWPRCPTEGCNGRRLEPFGVCLGHLSQSELDAFLQQIEREHRLDARGVIFTSSLSRRVFAALMDSKERVHLVDGRFDEATFQDDLPFRYARFEGATSFFQATFEGQAMFDFATFKGGAEFAGAVFKREKGWATFFRAEFDGEAWFDGAVFHGEVKFTGMQVNGDCGFWGTVFHRKATFDEMMVTGTTLFGEATFDGVATFVGTRLDGPVEFKRASFTSHVVFDPERMGPGGLALATVTFSRGINIEIRSGDVSLDESTFAAPSVLMGSREATRVVSVRGANLGSLLLTSVDLRPCLFAGAHALDRLRFERVTPFARTPRGFRFGRTWPFVWRWTDRQALAEEYAWRLAKDPAWKWTRWMEADAWQSPSWVESERPLNPDDISRLYRSLRKGREDNKDEAGASDFYYGEMEMRRNAAPKPSAEGVVLFLYWLFSGYALRASRALISLLALVFIFGLLFQAWGLTGSEGFLKTWIFSLETATNLLGQFTEDVRVNTVGELLQVALRVVGPLLLGLAVLSLRGRIRR
jgi:uncharacterized protein YjbI with pentapeptide repeats